MKNLLVRCCLAFILLLIAVAPALAQAEIPEPFCGKLDTEDCDLLRASNDAMLNLESYTASVTYQLVAKGLPEIAEDESGVTLRIDSRYVLNDDARQSMRFFAVQSRAEPLAAVDAIGKSPELLIKLYQGMTADLNFTVDVSKDWAQTLSESGDEITWPETTHVAARLVDGVLYIDIHELKSFIPKLKEQKDWVAIELVKIMEELAAKGTFQELAADVATSSTGRSVWGLDPAMLNLITSMRATFGRPKNLEPFMTIQRGKDVNLSDQKGAFYQINFAALDFILSEEFRNLLMQAVEVTAASKDDTTSKEELSSMVDLFWLFAPSIFRDLKISGDYTIGLDDQYQHAGKTVIHWDLKTVLRAIGQISGEALPNQSAESYIDFVTETKNAGFNEAISVAAPENAQIISSEELTNLEALGYESFKSGDEQSAQTTESDSTETENTEADNSGANNSENPAASNPQQNADASDTSQAAPPAVDDAKPATAGDAECDQAIDTALTAFTAEAYNDSMAALTDVINAACAESGYAHQLLGAAAYYHYEQVYNSAGKEQADPDEVYRAITLASKAIELDHNDARAYYYRGLAFESFKEYGHAVDDLSRAITLTPDDPYAYFPRARIYVEIGQTEQALNDYNKFLDLYKTDDQWRAQVEAKVKELQ